MDKRCFMPRGSLCSTDCMAFRGDRHNPRCALLDSLDDAANALIPISSFLTKPTSGTKHPKSAPPPEVNP